MPDNGSNAVYIVSQYISSVGATKKKDLGRHSHAPPRLGVVSQERYVRNETAADPSAVSIAEEKEAVKEDDSWVETCRLCRCRGSTKNNSLATAASVAHNVPLRPTSKTNSGTAVMAIV